MGRIWIEQQCPACGVKDLADIEDLEAGLLVCNMCGELMRDPEDAARALAAKIGGTTDE